MSGKLPRPNTLRSFLKNTKNLLIDVLSSTSHEGEQRKSDTSMWTIYQGKGEVQKERREVTLLLDIHVLLNGSPFSEKVSRTLLLILMKFRHFNITIIHYESVQEEFVRKLRRHYKRLRDFLKGENFLTAYFIYVRGWSLCSMKSGHKIITSLSIHLSTTVRKFISWIFPDLYLSVLKGLERLCVR